MKMSREEAIELVEKMAAELREGAKFRRTERPDSHASSPQQARKLRSMDLELARSSDRNAEALALVAALAKQTIRIEAVLRAP
jgi:5-enolpyruvylshikimate-3-phosphate synthase